MAKKITVTGTFEQYDIDQSNKTWIFDRKFAAVNPDGNALLVAPGITNTSIVLHGKAQAGAEFTGIVGRGEGLSITIAKGGEALGITGIFAQDANSTVINHGTTNSIRVAGEGSVVRNYGLIESNVVGIISQDVSECRIVNEKGGVIEVSLDENPYASAVKLRTLDGQSGIIVNHGLITSGTVSGQDGDDKFINFGTVRSAVLMWVGDDVIDIRGGKVTGPLYGNAGDDMLITRRASNVLQEAADEGIDTVRSTVTYQLNDHVERLELTGKKDINGTGTDNASWANYLQGNSGDNRLSGLAGTDGLSGGRGRDMLTGGAGSDFFELARRSGRDTVTDFVNGADRIVVNGFVGIDDYSDISSRIKYEEGFAEINMGKGDILIIRNATEGQLEASDFLFNIDDSVIFL